MKTQTRKPCLLLAAICAAGSAYGGPPRKVPQPTSVALVRRAVAAYDHMHYPVSAVIRDRLTLNVNSRKLIAIDITRYLRANDKRHWSRIAPGRNSWFVNGSVCVVYVAKTKRYISPAANAWELGNLFDPAGDVFDELRALLSDPKQRGRLASAKVAESKVLGAPVYVLTFPPRTMRANAIAIRKSDGLVCRFEVESPPDGRWVYTMQIKREPKPFPPSTFIRPFAEPPGCAEPDMKEPPTPSGPQM